MAMGYAHGSFVWSTADAVSATYSESGFGFQPKAIRFYWVAASGNFSGSQTVDWQVGVGFAASTSSRRCVTSFDDDANAAAVTGTAAYNDSCVAIISSTANLGKLDLQSLDTDGFTVVIDVQNTAATMIVMWEAWGGTDISNVTIGDIAEPAATGTQNYTATGFTSTDDDTQIFMMAGVQSTAAVNSILTESSGISIGFASGTAATENISVTGNSDSGSLAMDTDGACISEDCHMMINLAGAATVETRARLSAFGTDIVTLDWTARATTSRRSIYMAIKGGFWRVGEYTIDGSTLSATATVSGLPFRPLGFHTIGRMTAEQASNVATANARFGMGAGSSTLSRNCVGVLSEDTILVAEIDYFGSTSQVCCYASITGAGISLLDINAMNNDGFQIIVDTAGGVASQWQGYVAYGSKSSFVIQPPVHQYLGLLAR